MKKNSLLLVAFLLIMQFNTILAQTGFQNMKARVGNEARDGGVPNFSLNVDPKNSFLASILIDKDVNIPQANAQQWITAQLNLRAGIDELKITRDFVKTGGMEVIKLAQYFKGVCWSTASLI